MIFFLFLVPSIYRKVLVLWCFP